jgi:hypothetical protein
VPGALIAAACLFATIAIGGCASSTNRALGDQSVSSSAPGHGSLTDREFNVAVAIARAEADKDGAAISSATATIGKGTETAPNAGPPCTSGSLLHIKLIGTFNNIAVAGGPTVGNGYSVSALLITADPQSGKACLISVQTGSTTPDAGATLLPVGSAASSSDLPAPASASRPAGHGTLSAPPTPAPPSADLSTETGVLQHFFESDRDWLSRGLGGPNFGGRVYCAVDLLGQSSDGRDVYVWTLCQEFYGTTSTVELGTGVSAPVLLHVTGSGPHIVVTSWRMPGDGEGYAHDVATMFPASVARGVMHGTPDAGAETRLRQRATADLP